MRNLLLISGVFLLIIFTHSCKEKPTPPELTTTTATAISYTTATSGGEVTNEGGDPVIARGICWNTSADPTISNSKTTESGGLGTFISNITSLTPNTTYFVRAYGTNTAGTGYGESVTFTTLQVAVPVLTTTAITAITQTSAVSGGNITDDKGGTISARGVCWGTTTNPTLANSKTTDATGTGSFVSNLSGLLPGTLYYLRSYATNSSGTAYGNEISFTTQIATVPVLTTTAITSITQNSATSGGTITSDGASSITARGVCWSPSPGPRITNSKTSDATGTGVFTSSITGLTGNTTYYVRAYATNSIGTAYGTELTFTTSPTVPGAPTIGTATAGNAQATVTFTAPVSNGGSAITGYIVTSSSGSITGTGTASPITVTGLTNGTAYTFTVTATNAIGLSSASAATNSVTPVVPLTVPGAPTIGSASAGNAQATVTFTAPVSNGGSAITGYTVTSNPGSITGTGTASPISVTGLTNGTAYTFTVIATNAIGNSAASAGTNSVTPVVPLTVPGAPTIGTATAGNAQATITFTAPVSNGGSAITGYTVTSNPGSITGTGSASPIIVTGLTNGTAYTFTVIATNAIGNSIASTASSSVTPVAVPGAPTIGTATAGNGQATITFTAPVSNGGSAITGYTVTSSPGSLTANGTVSPITITGLTNGTAYTFTVKATNAIGTSVVSAASNSVTPSTVPGAPTIGTASAGSAQATITFTAPGNNGGSAITAYTVTSSPGSITGIGTASPVTVTGLTDGTAYTFTVTATNVIGTSSPSSASNSVTPLSVPGAPTAGIAYPGNTQATVTFTAPVSNGGSAITAYTVTSSPGSFTHAGTASPITVFGLTNGAAYTFTVTATSAIGTSLASTATNSVTPYVPAPVTDVESNVYSTVVIGTQTWMAANLQTTKYNNGTAIPNVTDMTAWSGLTSGAYCWYNNDTPPSAAYKVTYGAMYNWYVVNTGNLCPTGWHVPSDAEWKILEMFLGLTQAQADAVGSRGTNEGGKLREAGSTHWGNYYSGATNETGFTALPGGQRHNGLYDFVGQQGNWWSSSQYSTSNAWSRGLGYDGGYSARWNDSPKSYGFSVRCLKD